MRPYDYNDDRQESFSNDEFGRQAWNEYLNIDEVQEETSEAEIKDPNRIHLSPRAQRDLLEFSNDKLNRKSLRTFGRSHTSHSHTSRSYTGRSNTARNFVIGIGAATVLIGSLATGLVMMERNSYEYTEPEYIEPYHEEEIYEESIGNPVFEIDGYSYSLPVELQNLLTDDLSTDADLYSMIGADPVTITLLGWDNEPIAEMTVVSPDGSEIPLGKGTVTGITFRNSSYWIMLPSGIGLGFDSYSVEMALRDAGLPWTKTGSGTSSTYTIENTLEDGKTYHLTLHMDDNVINTIEMRVE